MDSNTPRDMTQASFMQDCVFCMISCTAIQSNILLSSIQRAIDEFSYKQYSYQLHASGPNVLRRHSFVVSAGIRSHLPVQTLLSQDRIPPSLIWRPFSKEIHAVTRDEKLSLSRPYDKSLGKVAEGQQPEMEV